MTKLSKVSIPRMLRFDNNKIISNDNDRLNRKLSKFKKSLALEAIFILLKLAFTEIQINKNDSLKYLILNLQYKVFGLT